MYHSMNINVKNGPIFDWCDELAHKANNLYNAALFRERQVMTSRKKTDAQLTDNEKEVLREIEVMNERLLSRNKKPRKISRTGYLSYEFLDDLMKLNENPDYICDTLPAHVAQHVLKHAAGDIRSFFGAMKQYKQDPSLFTGKPELPHYKHKQGICSFDISNQECVIRQNGKGHYVAKLPKTKCIVSLGKQVPGILKEVHVAPINGQYQISFVFDDGEELPAHITEQPERIASVDFGISNFMAVTNNCGLGCLLYKGGVIKSANHRYNQKIAAIMSRQTKGGTEKFKPTEEYYAVTQRRNNVIKDYMLQTGKHFITWCVENRIDTIVLGDNQFWKQNIRMGVVNNQNFVQIPFDQMKKILTYQAERRGIRLIRQEESYTSKANFLGQDDIPVYGRNDEDVRFTGTRIHRGLYKTNAGTLLNADINGSANILRKCISDAFRSHELAYNQITVVRHPMYEAVKENRNRQISK